jgi:hypothetical protein
MADTREERRARRLRREARQDRAPGAEVTLPDPAKNARLQVINARLVELATERDALKEERKVLLGKTAANG